MITLFDLEVRIDDKIKDYNLLKIHKMGTFFLSSFNLLILLAVSSIKLAKYEVKQSKQNNQKIYFIVYYPRVVVHLYPK
jgi:hypothetical protein